jgi:hypothetical protein
LRRWREELRRWRRKLRRHRENNLPRSGTEEKQEGAGRSKKVQERARRNREEREGARRNWAEQEEARRNPDEFLFSSVSPGFPNIGPSRSSRSDICLSSNENSPAENSFK